MEVGGQNELCRMGRTWWPVRTFMLSAEESLIDAIEEFLATTSPSGMNVCMMSGDSRGLFSEDPIVALTRKLFFLY